MQSRSRVATTAAALGAAAAGSALLGALLAWLGAVPPLAGFAMLGLGLLLALLAIALGLVGVWTTRAASGKTGRGRAIAGLGLGLALVLTVGALRSGVDRRADFNDVTTDLANPPGFTHAATLEPNLDRDLAYPRAFEPKQRELYPDLAPIAFDGSPADAYRAAEAAANALGWQITWGDGSAHLEATDTSRIFHFVDDVAIRIAPAAGGATIDVRSKSRDGRGDLGVNAARIRAFRDALGS